MQAYVIRDGGKVLLCRRRPDGLFGGLWEPPMVPRPADAYSEMLAQRLGAKLTRVRGKVEHVLTHRVLEVAVKRGSASRVEERAEAPEGYDRSGWFDPREMDSLGVSTLANKVLAKGGVRRAT